MKRSECDYRVRHLQTLCLLLVMAICILMMGLVYLGQIVKKQAAQLETAEIIGAQTLCADVLPVVPLPYIEQTGSGTEEPDTYFYDDIPLGIEEQKLLYDAAEEFDVPYTLALAVVEQETNYSNITGDGGDSIGYMQIQPRWWRGMMDKLDALDLTLPENNFRVGCAILRQLLDDHGTETDALTAYNTGRPGTSSYAASVLAIRDRLEAGE